MINEPFFIQENSKKAKLPLAAHNLACEQSDGFQGFGLSRPPSVPVLGRRLSSESIIVINDDNSSRFPLPIQLSQKYFRRKSIPTTFDTKNKERRQIRMPVCVKINASLQLFLQAWLNIFHEGDISFFPRA